MQVCRLQCVIVYTSREMLFAQMPLLMFALVATLVNAICCGPLAACVRGLCLQLIKSECINACLFNADQHAAMHTQLCTTALVKQQLYITECQRGNRTKSTRHSSELI